MEAIINWFDNGMDYNVGVTIYKGLPQCKSRILKKLERGKSNHNMAQLIKVLRVAKTEAKNTSEDKSIPTEKPDLPLPNKVTDEVITNHHHKKQLKQQSQKVVFGSVRYGELPHELRARYQEAAQLFYQMCDLKFALNDLPAEAQDESLSIQLQIEDIDAKRETIWKELHHWQNHKTLLPTEADTFANMSEADLYKKRNNLRSQCTKLKQRIDGYYTKLSTEENKHAIHLIEAQINRSEKKLHQHTLNIDKINDLL